MSSMARKRLPAAARRETIIDAATSAFATDGYDGARVARIAERVGVTEPVIFQNFGTKADLFAAVLDRASITDAEQLSGADDEGDVLELMARMLAPAVHDQLHTSGGLGVLYAEADGRSEPCIRDAFQRALGRAVEAFAAILGRGQRERSVGADVESTTLAWLVVSLIRAREFRRVHTTQPFEALEEQMLAADLDVLRPSDAA